MHYRHLKHHFFGILNTVKPVLSGHSKRRPKIGFQDQLSLNADQKYCRMPQEEYSVILSTFIKLRFVLKTFVLSIFEKPLKTDFTVVVFFLKKCFQNVYIFCDCDRNKELSQVV